MQACPAEKQEKNTSQFTSTKDNEGLVDWKKATVVFRENVHASEDAITAFVACAIDGTTTIGICTELYEIKGFKGNYDLSKRVINRLFMSNLTDITV